MNSTDETTLYLDTTTNQLFLALSQGSELIESLCIPCESHRYHSAVIVPAIQDILKASGLSVKQLSALAVNIGPGSFTGIRTGIITARTMAQFLDLPIYAFNAFEVYAPLSENPTRIYLDALRGRIYTATLSFQENGVYYHEAPVLRELTAEDMAPDTSKQCLISPSMSARFNEGNPEVISGIGQTPHAMQRLIARYGKAFQTNWAALEPFYLQEPSITPSKKRTSPS